MTVALVGGMRFLPNAAFWLLALAAHVSGYTSPNLAIGLAIVAALFLIWPAVYHFRAINRR